MIAQTLNCTSQNQIYLSNFWGAVHFGLGEFMLGGGRGVDEIRVKVCTVTQKWIQIHEIQMVSCICMVGLETRPS